MSEIESTPVEQTETADQSASAEQPEDPFSGPEDNRYGEAEDKHYGFTGDGPQQGTDTLADDKDGLYADGPEQGLRSQDEPGTFYSDEPFGGRPDH
ncbi:MAG: hypothetical protein WBG36_00760 [Ornithinimicrobium sp.]